MHKMFIFKKTIFLFICFITYKALLMITSCCKTFEKKLYTWHIFGTQREYSFCKRKIFGTIVTITEYALLEEKRRRSNRLLLYKKNGTSMVKKQDFLFKQQILYKFWVQNNIFNIHFLQKLVHIYVKKTGHNFFKQINKKWCTFVVQKRDILLFRNKIWHTFLVKK